MKTISRPIRIEENGGPPRYPVKEALAKVRSAIYRGHRVECSCCGREFGLFLFSPYQAALCPNCLSFERYRLLCRWLQDETDFGTREIEVLDIADLGVPGVLPPLRQRHLPFHRHRVAHGHAAHGHQGPRPPR